MDERQAFESLGFQVEDVFREATFQDFFGNHLFDPEEQDYFFFASPEPGDAVWLIGSRSKDRPYEVRLVKEAEKTQSNRAAARLCSFHHCEPIDDTWLEDRQVGKIKTRLKQGGKILAQKANKAFVDVLTRSVSAETTIHVQGRKLDEVLADVFSRMVSEGHRPDRFLFPEHLQGRLAQQGVIIRNNEIQNSHYAGKTITDQEAFWSSDLPRDIALVFHSAAGITLTGKPRFYLARLGPFLPGVCGDLSLNPIIRNTRAVLAIEGVEEALVRSVGSETAVPKVKSEDMYVDLDRIDQLRAVTSASFDLAKLIRLCEELNTCYANDCFFAVATLVRAILDHVPPIFGLRAFSEVSNNYGGTKSFKESMTHLEKSLRSIADHHLHVHIRNRETLPTRTQVDFRADLDVLLAEIVRLLK